MPQLTALFYSHIHRVSTHAGDCRSKWSRPGKFTGGINHAGMVGQVPKERIQLALIIRPSATVLYEDNVHN